MFVYVPLITPLKGSRKKKKKKLPNSSRRTLISQVYTHIVVLDQYITQVSQYNTNNNSSNYKKKKKKRVKCKIDVGH